MYNVLIATNICNGSVKSGCTLATKNGWEIATKIVKNSARFDYTFIVNDRHTIDDHELKFLPNHMSDTLETGKLYTLDSQIESKYFQYLRKNTLSALYSGHNKNCICNIDNPKYYLAGFYFSLDILATFFDLFQAGKDVSIIIDCVDDISEYNKKCAEYILSSLSIPLVKVKEIILA